jgi:DNA-binding ferritin-like protein (Dps family)
VKPGSQKTVKQLLGELYADKVYLEKLLEDDRKIYNEKQKNKINNSNNSNNTTNRFKKDNNKNNNNDS